MNISERNSEMSEEMKYLRSEFIKTIEFIKGRMLTFLYYSFLLQAGIIAYSKLFGVASGICNLLIWVSFLVASGTMYFLLKYHRDYKYALYRYDIFIDSEFSNRAMASLDVPYFEKETIELTIKAYFRFFKGEQFMYLYSVFNWGVCFFVILFFAMIKGIDTYKSIILGSIILTMALLLTLLIAAFIREETRTILKKHKFYSDFLRSQALKVSRTDIEKQLNKFNSKCSKDERLRQIGREERVYKKLLKKLETEKRKLGKEN